MDAGVAGQAAVGHHAQPEDHELGGKVASGGVDRTGREAGDGNTGADVDAHALHGVADQSAHVGVERAHDRRRLLDDRHRRPAAQEGLGHLQADVATSDDHDLTGAGRPGALEQMSCILQGLHATDLAAVHAGEVRSEGPGAQP